ncbi:MAG: tetratricopeptide repeat protein [Lawsonibacter sp.]|jgi:tetratricopeptide (TPR) repeat protein|nr:tetratricopeptide repeat protein [Lawsonibacter sp.]
MKRSWLLIFLSILLLAGCGKSNSPTTWQEQYDLGVRYLSEGNYEEAIIAFTAAIEIDPKRAEAYVGRGDAYVGSVETEENLAAAQADYEKAIELDESNIDAYLGLANVYIQQGDYERTLDILKKGAEKTEDNQKILDILTEISGGESTSDSTGTEKNTDYNIYGATEFTQRESYQAIEDLTTDEVFFLRGALKSVTQNDMNSLDQLSRAYVENSGHDVFSVLTLLDGYKIQMNVSPDHNGMGTSLEIRPKEGMGYGLYIVSDNGGVSGSCTSCVCSNWQWNGVATELVLEQGDIYCYATIPMKEGLRDGAVVTTYPASSITHSPEYTEIYNEFQDGIMIKANGTSVEPDNYFWGLTHGTSGPLSSQSTLDDLYW